MPNITLSQAEMDLAAGALRAEAMERQRDATSRPHFTTPEHNRRLLLSEARILINLAERMERRAKEPIMPHPRLSSQLAHY